MPYIVSACVLFYVFFLSRCAIKYIIISFGDLCLVSECSFAFIYQDNVIVSSLYKKLHQNRPLEFYFEGIINKQTYKILHLQYYCHSNMINLL